MLVAPELLRRLRLLWTASVSPSPLATLVSFKFELRPVVMPAGSFMVGSGAMLGRALTDLPLKIKTTIAI
jgi:hypothetical protein